MKVIDKKRNDLLEGRFRTRIECFKCGSIYDIEEEDIYIKAESPGYNIYFGEYAGLYELCELDTYTKENMDNCKSHGGTSLDYLTNCPICGESKKIETYKFHENARIRIIDAYVKKYPPKDAKDEKSKSGCYIATAIYGSYDSPEVVILRKYRDEFLLKSFYGRIFVKAYYTLSPLIAKWLKDKRKVNYIVKKILNYIVKKVSK